MKNKKLFVVIEGIDGVGKTTIIKELKNKLEKLNIKIFVTSEPNESLGSFKIRDILLNHDIKLKPMTELFLFLLDRNLHIEKKINVWKKNKTEKTEIILCDRSFFSSFVYQGKVGGILLDDIYDLHEKTNSFFWPDLTFFIDVRNKKDFEILKKRNLIKKDRIEKNNKNKYKKISDYYNELIEYFKHKKPSLKIESIKWTELSKDMIINIYEKIINKLNEN